MWKLGANQKLKSGIFCVLESGICNGRIRNPAPGIRNPQRKIQNLILSWITLHGASCSSLVVTCCVTCYFDSDPPYAGKRFIALNHVLWIEEIVAEFLLFFLVPSLPFNPLFLCNLNTEIFFGQRIIITMVALKYQYKNYLPSVTAISCYGRGTKIFFQAHLFELGNLQNTGLTEHRPASD